MEIDGRTEGVLKKSSDGDKSEEKAGSRKASPTLNQLLQNKAKVSGSRLGPRRTLSEMPMDSKKEYELNDSKLQDLAVVTNWHIPFEKIKLMEELGKGTFKIVYRGTYLDTAVAIAEIIGVKKSDFVNVENELKILQHIRHPNTLLFIGVSYAEDKFYIVTELAQLGALDDLLKESGQTLSWRCKLRMAEEIAHALAYLHDRGVFHRDLKAENVLVFPGDNDGYLLKLADFGLGFLKDEAGINIGASMAQSQVGTVWIRAPEVDEKTTYDPAAVDVFSYGMVLVDLLTNGGGEEMRWEVAYQKKDPVTGKNLLSFGLNTDHLRELLTRKSNKRPAGLVALAVECASEDPKKRPSLSNVSQRLSVLLEKFTQSETVRQHLQEALEKRETQALVASAAIKSEEGMNIWSSVSGNLKLKSVQCSVVWNHCLELFESLGSRVLLAEAEVLAEAVGYNDDASMDASIFAHIWERLEPVLELFRNEQVRHLWAKNLCGLLSDRSSANAALAVPSNRRSIVLRISNTFAGKLTISSMGPNKQTVHQLVTIDAYAVILGKGIDCKTFEGLNDLFDYLVGCGFTSLLGRDNKTCHDLKALSSSLPRPAKLADSGDAYSLLLQNPLEASNK